MNMHVSPLDPALSEPLRADPLRAEPLRAEPPAAPPRSWARRNAPWLALAAVVLGLAAFYLLRPAKGDGAAPPTPAPRVTVVAPGVATVASDVTATGSIAARRDLPVGIAGEGGQVDAVRAEAGQYVRRGQVLADIESSVQRAQLAQLRLSVAQAQADARLAQAELDRAQALVARGFISRADIDRRTATRDSANARVGVARAQVREQEARIARLAVRAPADGVVLQRTAEVGQIVSPGAGALFRIAEGGVLELRAQVSEQDLARIRVGMSAQVTPTGLTRSYPGRVWLVEPLIDPQTRQGVARVRLAYAPGLFVGAFGRAVIAAGETRAPVLPQSAVLTDNAGTYVLVVGADNRVQRRGVAVGQVGDAGVSIARGLTGQERVVASAGAFLRAGDKVVPVFAAPAR